MNLSHKISIKTLDGTPKKKIFRVCNKNCHDLKTFFFFVNTIVCYQQQQQTKNKNK